MEKETNKFHALQLFTDTFAAETVHLTNEQVGIYIRLLCFAWTKNTKPFTTNSAYRICQCIDDKCKRKVDGILIEFFKKKSIETPGSLVITLADFEDLKGHSKSVKLRINK